MMPKSDSFLTFCWISLLLDGLLRKQLDVEVSPPANIMTLRWPPCDLWTWPTWPLTLTDDPWPRTLPVRRSNRTWNHIFDLVPLSYDLDLQGWPLTLTHMTFEFDPCDPWPQRLPVRRSNEAWNNFFFNLVTLTFDLWPWRSSMFSPNFMTIGALVLEI